MTVDQVIHQLEDLRARLDEVQSAYEHEHESYALATQHRWFKDLIALLESVMPDEIPIFQTGLNQSTISSNRTIGSNPAVGMFMDHVGRPADAYLVQLIASLKKGRRKLKPIEVIGNSKQASEEQMQSNQIFIVHGHDEAMKQSVARTLMKLKLDPIILHEQPNAGKTIIEKFERDSSLVGFAVVLLSPDDMGYMKDDGAEKAKPRARQNVILELGYFVGRLGRDKVMALKRGDDLEVPSDLSGVVYTPFDSHGAWEMKLLKELKAAWYNVDANHL